MSINTLRRSAFAVFALVMGATMSANAAAVVTITAGPFSSVAGSTTTTFDSGSLPSDFTAMGSKAGVVSGSVPDAYAAPTGDKTPFAYVGPGSWIKDTFTSPVSDFGLYWGSPDSYNTLVLTDANGSTYTFGEGGMAVPGLNTSNQVSVYVNFLSTGAAFTSATFTSSVAAFEFDNVSTVPAATPEPASIALMAGGLLAVAAGLSRRRKAA